MATAGPFQGADGVRLDDEQAGPGPAILDEKKRRTAEIFNLVRIDPGPVDNRFGGPVFCG